MSVKDALSKLDEGIEKYKKFYWNPAHLEELREILVASGKDEPTDIEEIKGYCAKVFCRFEDIERRVEGNFAEMRSMKDSQESVKWTLNSARKQIDDVERRVTLLENQAYPRLVEEVVHDPMRTEQENKEVHDEGKEYKCPNCGGNETWFDRTCDAYGQGMTTRCSGCGCDVDKPSPEVKNHGTCPLCGELHLGICKERLNNLSTKVKEEKHIEECVKSGLVCACNKCIQERNDTIQIPRALAEEAIRTRVELPNYLYDAIKTAIGGGK